MAETITRQLREPFVEAAGLGITNKGLGLLGKSIPTSTYTGRQFVQGQSGLEQQAATAAAGLGALTGPQGYQQFQSPYQQQVIDASLAEFDRNAAVQQTGLRDQAIQSGAYGGGREGIMQAEAMRNNQLNRGQLQSGLLQEGFQNAQQQALLQLQAQQGLGTYQSQLGGTQRQIAQGQLAADQEAAREAAFADYTQLGLVAPQLASVIGGFPAATQMQSTPPPSTTQQLLGLGIGAAGLGGAVRGMFSN
jgi:hypothetical protein